MNTNRFGLTPDEIDDEAQHFHAEGTVLVRAIADEISEIAQKGDRISRLELKRLHAQLVNVYELIGSAEAHLRRARVQRALSRARTTTASVAINGQATGVDPTVERDLAGSKQEG